MNKRLSKKIIKKMIGIGFDGLACGPGLTGQEINLLLHLALLQDTQGLVKGIHYTQVMTAIGITKRHFYKCMDALAAKGIIKIIDTDAQWEAKEYSFFTVQILDNVYDDPSEFKNNPFLSLNYNVLHDPLFLKLKRNEKRLVIRLLEISFNYLDKENWREKRPMIIGYGVMMEWLGVSLRALKGYIDNIQKVLPLSNDAENKKIHIAVLSEAFEDVNEEKQEQALGKLINYIASETEAQVSEKDLSSCMRVIFNITQEHLSVLNAHTIKYYIKETIRKTGGLVGEMLNNLMGAVYPLNARF